MEDAFTLVFLPYFVVAQPIANNVSGVSHPFFPAVGAALEFAGMTDHMGLMATLAGEQRDEVPALFTRRSHTYQNKCSGQLTCGHVRHIV